MPFIPKEQREMIDRMVDSSKALDELIARVFGTFGEEGVAYVTYAFVKQSYGYGRWRHRADGVKILRCVEKEFYESALREYENEKKKLNGDVV